MQKSAENLLLSLYRRDKLAPFYIIRGPIIDSYTPLLEWAHDFAASLLAEHKNVPLSHAEEMISLGHSDLLFIDKQKEKGEKGEDEDRDNEKDYKVNDPHINEYFKAQQYGPLELKHKFIFINKAQLIGEYFANKWLKTLEEPQENITTIFLVENQKPLLGTIESRGVELRAHIQGSEHHYPTVGLDESFADFLLRESSSLDFPKGAQTKLENYCKNSQKSHLFLEVVREYPQLRGPIFNIMNDYIVAPHHNIHAQSHWIEELKWFNTAKQFNNNIAERFYGLIKCLSESSGL